MNIVEKTIITPCDLFNRNAHNFAYKISWLPSNIMISTLDNAPINAKSILGLLSLCVRKGTMIRIASFNENSKIAEEDLEKAIEILNNLVVSENE